MLNLQELNAIWGNIKPSGGTTLIPDGDHIAVLEDANFSSDTMTLWCKWKFPDFDDRILSNPINFVDRNGALNERGVAAAKGLFIVLGAPLESAESVQDNIPGVIGSRVRVKLVTTTSPTNGKKYTKIYANELLGREEGAAVPFEI